MDRVKVGGLGVVAKTLLLVFAFALIAAGRAAAQTTVIVVRHAEKVDDSADPALSEAGAARADALAGALRDARLTAVYTTQYRRTQLTAEPAARAAGVTPVVIAAGSPTQAHIDLLAARISEADAGSTVLVVGHSNTVPLIVRTLTGAEVGSIEDSEYDHFFVVTLRPDAAPQLVRARYGH